MNSRTEVSTVVQTEEVAKPAKFNLDLVKYIIFVVSFYTYIAGALYFYGRMDGFGFEGASINSVFAPLVYSLQLISDIFSNVSKVELADLLVVIRASLLPTLVLVPVALLVQYRVWRKIPSRFKAKLKMAKPSLDDVPVIMALLMCPIYLLVFMFSMLVLLSASSVVALFLAIPYSVGSASAQAMLENQNGVVCRKFNWNDAEYRRKDVIPGCERVRIGNEGDFITGSVIHSDQDYAYVHTNHLLVTVKDGNVVSCSKKQRRNAIDPKEDEGVDNGFTSCRDFFKTPEKTEE